MYLKILFLVTLISLVHARKAPKVHSDESDDSFVSKPLTYKTYKKYLESNSIVFVKFFTNWCHFSKKVFDVWENLGEKYANDKRIQIAEMDCEPEKNKKVCKSFKVRGYPALIIFKDGKKYEKFIGERKLEDFVTYVDDFLREEAEAKKNLTMQIKK